MVENKTNNSVNLISVSISSIFLKRKNWMKSQLFGNSEQLQLMEKIIIQHTIILMMRN